MRIRDLADKPGTAGKWRSHDRFSHPGHRWTRSIYHYSTEMVWFTIDDEKGQFDDDIVEAYIGHGSRSDQDGVNQIFARIGALLEYRRDGNDPRIMDLQDRHFRYGISAVQDRLRPNDKTMHGWRFPKRINENFTFSEPDGWARWVVGG